MAFSLLLKPVSSECNLNCTYCYYNHTSKAEQESRHLKRMSESVLQRVIEAYMQTDQDQYSMVWHGGEPTLMPVSFFEKIVHFQKQYASSGTRISNSVQTNGTMISNRLAAFWAKYRFMCGVSLDGPPNLHNRYRLTHKSKPTHSKVIKGINLLNRTSVPLNILTLVHRVNVLKPLLVYHYLKNLKNPFIQFIPCLEWDELAGKRQEYSITGKEWGEFLIAVFDDWFKHDMGRISIRYFEAILAKLVHGTAIDCYNSNACNRYLVVEYNGDVYPCDFYVRNANKLGNILVNSFESMLESSAYQTFSNQKHDWNPSCNACEFKLLCMGDCPKFRYLQPGSTSAISLLCEGWKNFYEHTLDRFHLLARQITLNQKGA